MRSHTPHELAKVELRGLEYNSSQSIWIDSLSVWISRSNFAVSAEAYPVDSGSPTYSVLSGSNRAATRTPFDGRRSFACAIPEGLL